MSLYLVAPDFATDKCLKLQSTGKWLHVVWYTSSPRTLVHYLTNTITSHHILSHMQ